MTRGDLIGLQTAMKTAEQKKNDSYSLRDGTVDRDLAYRVDLLKHYRAEDAYNNALDEYAKETA